MGSDPGLSLMWIQPGPDPHATLSMGTLTKNFALKLPIDNEKKKKTHHFHH